MYIVTYDKLGLEKVQQLQYRSSCENISIQ